MKATIAVLGFILSSAAKHNVDSESLSSELQQLGLPKGNGEGGHPGGVTKGWTWWDVLGLSWQPPALPPSRPDPVRDGSHAVLRHLPSVPSVLGGAPPGASPGFGRSGAGVSVWFSCLLSSGPGQSMLAGCAGPTRRSRAPSRTASGPAA